MLIYRILILLLFLVPCNLNQSIQAQSRSPFLKWTYSDAAALLGDVNGKTIFYTAGALGLVSVLTTLDEPVRSAHDAGVSNFLDGYSNTANLLGEPYFVVSASLGVFGISLLTRNFKFQDAAFTAVQSLVYASSTSLILKFLIGRQRPFESTSAYKFNPFSGHSSFPSGHATAAFAVLVPWALYYPGILSWSLVGLAAGGTAYARIVMNKHWFTDVVAGSALGFMTAFLLSRRHQKMYDTHEKRASSFRLVPALSAGHPGLHLFYSF